MGAKHRGVGGDSKRGGVYKSSKRSEKSRKVNKIEFSGNGPVDRSLATEWATIYPTLIIFIILYYYIRNVVDS